MPAASGLGEHQAETGEWHGVRVLANETQGEGRQVAVRAPRPVAVLEQVVRAVLSDVPEVSPDGREPSLAEDVRLEPVELELVFLLVRERPCLDVGLLVERIAFPKTAERADGDEVAEPGMNRAVGDGRSESSSDVALRVGDGASEVVCRDGLEDDGSGVLLSGNRRHAEAAVASPAIQTLNAASARLARAGFAARLAALRADRFGDHRVLLVLAVRVQKAVEDCG